MAANAEPETRQIYEFGPFRLDSGKELLLREDETVPIAPKAFQILLVLMRNSKQVVTKDDLMKAVWPDTFVEEANLSRNIFLLRRALGDSPQDHQYIVTVPGRGYRFAEDVQLVSDHELDVVAASHTNIEVLTEETRPWGWISIGIGAAVLLAIAVGAYRHVVRRAPVLTVTDTVLLADFVNSTGDSVFDGALRQGLEVQLQQSPYLKLVSRDRIQQTLGLMDQPSGTRVTGEVARNICMRTGSAAVLESSIQNVGAKYVLSLNATNCRTGDVMDREQAEVSSKEEVLGAIGRLAIGFRKRVGESGATLQKYDVPLAQATTASIDALKSYSLGLEAESNKSGEASIPFFKRAIEIDPKFAMAYAWLGLEYGSTGEAKLATENITRAHELADHVSDNERFFIEAYYAGRATGNEEKAREICEEWAAAYPRDSFPHSFLAGFIYPALANYEKAIDEARTGMRIAPEFYFFKFALGENSLYAGRLDGAEEALRAVPERKIDTTELLILRYDLAFLKEDQQGMLQAVNAAQGEPYSMDWMADRQASSRAYAGQLYGARALSHQAIELARQEGDYERAAQFAIRLAIWEAFFGDARDAKQDATTALGLARNRGLEYGAAVVFGLAGDTGRAQALGDDLARRLPEDTSVRFSYLPVIHAILDLDRGRPDAAIEALEIATPYELGAPRCAVVSFFGALYPILIRGDAYLAAGKGPEAAREFHKIIDHRTVMIGDATEVMAHYGLARSYALSGDSASVRKEYSKFLALWKDANPNLPVLRQARAEYAKLH